MKNQIFKQIIYLFIFYNSLYEFNEHMDILQIFC